MSVRVLARKIDISNNSLPNTLHPVLRRVLLARGISEASQIDLRLNRLSDPQSLQGLETAAGLLSTSVEMVTIYRRVSLDGPFEKVAEIFNPDGPATGFASSVALLGESAIVVTAPHWENEAYPGRRPSGFPRS